MRGSNNLNKLQALKENMAGLCRDLHPAAAAGSARGAELRQSRETNSNSASKGPRETIGLPLNAPVKISSQLYKRRGPFAAIIGAIEKDVIHVNHFVCLQRV
jgi:hypothetical protein